VFALIMFLISLQRESDELLKKLGYEYQEYVWKKANM
jgi:protein-S-isoprenylcysteine O-methyltransferase Ste14